MQNEIRARPRRSPRLSTGLSTAGLVVAIALGGGCATMSAQSTAAKAQVDPSRLAGLPSDQLTLVAEQEKNLRDAKADHEASKHAKEDAENRVKLAEADRDVANAELSGAKKQFEIAKKANEQNTTTFTQPQGTPATGNPPTTLVSPSQQELASAQQAVQTAQLRVDEENAKVDYLKSLVNIASANENLSAKRVSLAQAQLQRARFLTVQRVNPAEAQAMNVQPQIFDAAVADAQAQVAQASGDMSRARADAASKYHSWLTLNEQLGQASQRPSERASVPPPPQG